jgi:O-antigen/teichoic acid export membrane protein
LIGGWIGGDLLIRFFFRAYPAARPVLPWLLVATVAWGIARPYYSYFSSQGFLRTALYCNAAGLAANLVFCALWIPSQGALGAARACLVSYVSQSALFWAAFQRTPSPPSETGESTV